MGARRKRTAEKAERRRFTLAEKMRYVEDARSAGVERGAYLRAQKLQAHQLRRWEKELEQYGIAPHDSGEAQTNGHAANGHAANSHAVSQAPSQNGELAAALKENRILRDTVVDLLIRLKDSGHVRL